MHDTADLEARGIPAIYVATVEFSDAARGQAEAIGADPLGVFVRHPIQDRSDAEMRALGRDTFSEILDALEDAGEKPD